MEEPVGNISHSGWRTALRVLFFIFTPIVVIVGVFIIGMGLETLSKETHLFYQRTEPMLLTIIPLILVFWIALVNSWSGKKVLARKIVGISLAIVIAFLGLTTTLETVNTKPIVAAAESFKVPSEYQRITSGNSDKFAPAPSGIVPCVDFMGEGCPHISRTWRLPENIPSDAQIQRILDESGWVNVKKIPDSPFAGKSSYLYEAEGMVNGYKATVSIVELYDHRYEMRMYLRPANGPR